MAPVDQSSDYKLLHVSGSLVQSNTPYLLLHPERPTSLVVLKCAGKPSGAAATHIRVDFGTAQREALGPRKRKELGPALMNIEEQLAPI